MAEPYFQSVKFVSSQQVAPSGTRSGRSVQILYRGCKSLYRRSKALPQQPQPKASLFSDLIKRISGRFVFIAHFPAHSPRIAAAALNVMPV